MIELEKFIFPPPLSRVISFVRTTALVKERSPPVVVIPRPILAGLLVNVIFPPPPLNVPAPERSPAIPMALAPDWIDASKIPLQITEPKVSELSCVVRVLPASIVRVAVVQSPVIVVFADICTLLNTSPITVDPFVVSKTINPPLGVNADEKSPPISVCPADAVKFVTVTFPFISTSVPRVPFPLRKVPPPVRFPVIVTASAKPVCPVASKVPPTVALPVIVNELAPVERVPETT